MSIQNYTTCCLGFNSLSLAKVVTEYQSCTTLHNLAFNITLLLVQDFAWSSGSTPVKHLSLIGILLNVVTLPLVLGFDGMPRCCFS